MSRGLCRHVEGTEGSVGRTDFAIATGPGPRGWRRVILPFRMMAYRLVRPLLLGQVTIHQELERQSGELARLEGEIARLGHHLEAANRAVADARTELTALSQRVRQALALGWDHVAVVRRLAAIEDRLHLQDSSHTAEADSEAALKVPLAQAATQPLSRKCG